MLYTKQEKQIIVEALLYYSKAMKKKEYNTNNIEYGYKSLVSERIAKELERNNG